MFEEGCAGRYLACQLGGLQVFNVLVSLKWLNYVHPARG